MLYYVGQIIYVSFDPAVHGRLFNHQADVTGWVTYFGWLAGCYYIYVFCLRQCFFEVTSAMCQVDFPLLPSYNRWRWRTWWIYYVYIVPSRRGCWWLAGAVGRKGGDNDYSVVVYYDLCRPLASGIYVYI